ncbi:hypothetical protein xavtCFBP7764_14330 [Xanthomonas citri]|nr:hypothetical protein xavtCFBP7764_14330 [Xanthomonas citri]
MPRQSLQGRTCSVSRDGGRARTLQPSCRSAASGLCRWRMARHVRCRASSLASCAADDARIRRRDWIIPPPGLLIPSLRGL